jgi:hypothetical protein
MAILASTLVVTSRRSLRNFSTRAYVDSTKSSENIDFFLRQSRYQQICLGEKSPKPVRSVTIDGVHDLIDR